MIIVNCFDEYSELKSLSANREITKCSVSVLLEICSFLKLYMFVLYNNRFKFSVV